MIVKTGSGFVKGECVIGVNNLEQFRFTSIPYAKPPLGLLRFSPPVPIEPWDGVKDVTDLPNVCCQIDYDDRSSIIGSEDCLYLNIFSSNVKPDTLMPVMFWIGGWAFTFDNVSAMGPELLLEKGVVFVQCVYRQGPFGFLSTGDANAPGNSGLKDIVLGLRWIKQNISCFGGDPDSITIFGTSSGAAIVHYMMLSPSTAGLFHKAIAQSGSALNIWAMQRNPSQTAIKLAKELGKETTDLIEVLDFLRSVPAVEIAKACDRMGTKKAYKRQLTLGDYQFLPCREVEMEGIEPFITKNPLRMIKSNMYHKVPLIIGSNKNESSLFLETLKQPLKEHLSLVSHDFDILVPEELMDLKDSYLTKEVGKQILEFYIQDGVITQESLEQYLQYLADYYFIFHIQKTLKLHASNNNESPIYYYIFEFIGNWDLPKKWCGNEATHSDELAYLFALSSEAYKGNHDTVRTRQRFIKMWTNFAKYGNPTPDENDKLLQVNWEPVKDPEKLIYLNIGSELTLGRNPYADRMEFWNEIFEKTLNVRIMSFFEDDNKTS